MPLLVRVLAGNPATSAAILGCLDTVDASRLRRLYPAVAAVVAGVPWADMATPVVDVMRWRAALPAAVGARVAQLLIRRLAPPALAALAGTTHLDLQGCGFVTDELLLGLPVSLHTLNVSDCYSLTRNARLVHLPALSALNCHGTRVVDGGVAGLPASLQELDIAGVRLPARASLTHLACLRVLRIPGPLDAVMLASLPPSLLELHAASYRSLAPGASFAHLPVLHTLDVSRTDIDDASLASMPSSLVSFNAHECKNLTPSAVLPPLPLLQLLDVSITGIGDALVASLPVGLAELRMSYCRNVTVGATLDHLRALRVLHCIHTHLAPAMLDACRARGCAVLRVSCAGTGTPFTHLRYWQTAGWRVVTPPARCGCGMWRRAGEKRTWSLIPVVRWLHWRRCRTATASPPPW